ncbi:HD domain-containing protein [Paenibacillus sp. HB172176]|uniref:HD domain-containing protein n=1 Tax=Paenibacillus sp. HB172176 TaxID=2493690 RepID=UPI00143AF00A|nr:HD domain-containing protein [Paenibacillus sp. HB172176]
MNVDYRLRLDGALDELYEPLWQVTVKLHDEEKALLRCAKLRRLHMVRHGGASFINSHHTYSRLQHTLGVFALAARFEPDNRALRIAALLHDCGCFGKYINFLKKSCQIQIWVFIIYIRR